MEQLFENKCSITAERMSSCSNQPEDDYFSNFTDATVIVDDELPRFPNYTATQPIPINSQRPTLWRSATTGPHLTPEQSRSSLGPIPEPLSFQDLKFRMSSPLLPSPSAMSQSSGSLKNSPSLDRLRKNHVRIRKISTLSKDEQQRVNMINTGKKKFNLSPKSGIQYLAEHGYFTSVDPAPLDIAKFLYEENVMLSRTVLGDFLGDESATNIAILKQFVRQHQFNGMKFDEALRKFLLYFKLPGEAQKIDRIIERFAEQYVECNPDHIIFQSVDTAYILAFSLIILNTDLHNPAVKNKIKKASFIRNSLDIVLKNAIEMTAFSAEQSAYIVDYLQFLYDSILDEPFQFTDPEHDDPLNNNPLFFTFANPEREGWLIKQGGRIKTWKRRYCILTDSCLYYFKNSVCDDFMDMTHQQIMSLPEKVRMQTPCGIIPLEDLHIEPIDNADIPIGGATAANKKYFFKLYLHKNCCHDENTVPSFKNGKLIKAAKTSSDGRMIEGKHSEYLFMCENEDARNDWVDSINAQMAKPPVFTLYEQRKHRIGYNQSQLSQRQ